MTLADDAKLNLSETNTCVDDIIIIGKMTFNIGEYPLHIVCPYIFSEYQDFYSIQLVYLYKSIIPYVWKYEAILAIVRISAIIHSVYGNNLLQN